MELNYDRLLKEEMAKLKPEQKILFFRTFIEELFNSNPDEVEGIAGIRIIERAEERPEGESCFEYYFGDNDAQAVTDDMMKNWKLLTIPTPGAFVLYSILDLASDTIHPRHIGKITDTGDVRSKWGISGHVYDHNIAAVPWAYGNHITMSLPTNEQLLRFSR